jgi:hypothetical protein
VIDSEARQGVPYMGQEQIQNLKHEKKLLTLREEEIYKQQEWDDKIIPLDDFIQ